MRCTRRYCNHNIPTLNALSSELNCSMGLRSSNVALFEPFRFTALFALFTMVLVAAYLSYYPPQSPPIRVQNVSIPDDIPEIWVRLGAKKRTDVEKLSLSLPRRKIFEELVAEALAPWSSAISGGESAPLSTKLFDSMEVPNKESTARIFLPGDGRVLYRVVEHWERTYRLPRLVFFMDLLLKLMRRYPQVKKLRCEFYLNTADGPKVTVDSMSQEFGATPMLGFRTESHHIDIAVPDPVEHGSKVTGEGYVIEKDMRTKWTEKKNVAVFRGVASCIQKQHFGNWHLNPRVRVSSISSRFSDLLDAGVTKWIKLSHNTTIEEIETSANITTKEPLTLQEQMRYKYILDIDGGLGSSRKRWMLLSGSTALFQKSAITQWYEPLLAPWVHYVPVDRWFRDLIQHIRWCRQNDHEAKQLAQNGMVFAERFLSQEAIQEYITVLLQNYAKLQPNARRGNESVPDPCAEEPSIRYGPMGCRTGWFRHILEKPIPFGCRYKQEEEESFSCYRPNPISGRKENKNGVFKPYPYVEGIEQPRRNNLTAQFYDRIVP